jgi:PEP-CTERM motif
VENGYTGYSEIDVFGTPLFAPGDANRNGVVDINDFIVISNNFSKVPSSPGLDGDVVVDNIVNVLDFRLWKSNVTAEVAALAAGFAVPEPSAMLLTGLALAGLTIVRRRS